MLAVVPSTHHLALSELGEALQRRPLRLARENELGNLFPDCELGALPALGGAYGIPTIVERELDAQPDVYFEAGDGARISAVSIPAWVASRAGRRHSPRNRQPGGRSRGHESIVLREWFARV